MYKLDIKSNVAELHFSVFILQNFHIWLKINYKENIVFVNVKCQHPIGGIKKYKIALSQDTVLIFL